MRLIHRLKTKVYDSMDKVTLTFNPYVNDLYNTFLLTNNVDINTSIEILKYFNNKRLYYKHGDDVKGFVRHESKRIRLSDWMTKDGAIYINHEPILNEFYKECREAKLWLDMEEYEVNSLLVLLYKDYIYSLNKTCDYLVKIEERW